MVYWDADDRKDLIVGQSDGRIIFFRNIGTDDDPTFDGGTYLQVGEPGFKEDIDVGTRPTPTVVDWNSDYKKDLAIGALDGKIHLYINEGTHFLPDFQTESFAQESGGDLLVPTGRSSPAIRDLDNDGKKDLLVGNTAGQLLFYPNTGTDEAPYFSGYSPVTSEGVPIDLPGDPRSRPFLCDWNLDGVLDVLIGAKEDGLDYGKVRLYRGVPQIFPKWSQPLDDPSVNFDAASDLWWPEPDAPPGPVVKWEQQPDPNWPGLHAHDWADVAYHWISLADQWQCEDGLVHDLHWWGNYELMPDSAVEWRGSGISHFHISIHANAPADPWCLPGAELWSTDVPFSAGFEQPTGLVNNEGSPIYLYEFDLPEPFEQTAGEIYWVDIEAHSVDASDPAHWRWQETARHFPPIICPAAQRQDGGPWSSIGWPNMTYSDMAFRVTSVIEEVNKVVADDFVSDGRPIAVVRWWGSYFDERYVGGSGDVEHVLDGWFLTFHWAYVNAHPECPPGIPFDPPPTALGVYFAPAHAVEISPLDCLDCLGHALYEYMVDFDECCLLCAHADPRSGFIPAQPGEFDEERFLHYWLSIQAVTGVEWIPPECEMVYTGHLPSDLPGNDGHFWGWHSTQPMLPIETEEACTGKIADFLPYPPDCWDYGEWVKQPYACPNPEPLPVHMSFELFAGPCVADANGDGRTDLSDLGILLAAYGTSWADPGYDPRVDYNGDGYVNLSDLGVLLADYYCGVFGS